MKSEERRRKNLVVIKDVMKNNEQRKSKFLTEKENLLQLIKS